MKETRNYQWGVGMFSEHCPELMNATQSQSETAYWSQRNHDISSAGADHADRNSSGSQDNKQTTVDGSHEDVHTLTSVKSHIYSMRTKKNYWERRKRKNKEHKRICSTDLQQQSLSRLDLSSFIVYCVIHFTVSKEGQCLGERMSWISYVVVRKLIAPLFFHCSINIRILWRLILTGVYGAGKRMFKNLMKAVGTRCPDVTPSPNLPPSLMLPKLPNLC